MKHAFIFHGTAGHPEENWFPWLRNELQSLGFHVHIPQFPTPENQTLETWWDIFRNEEELVDAHTLMVGHSLGGAFLLRVLERLRKQIAIACLVATPVGIPPIRNWEGDQPFIGHPFDWRTIRARARHFVVYHSDNDPYISLGNGQEAATQLGVELSLVPNAGHFNTAAGYTRFQELLDDIKKLIAHAPE